MSYFSTSLRLTCLFATSALAFSAACGNGDDDDVMTPADAGADAQVATQDASTTDTGTAAAYTDAQVVQILITFDDGEVTEGSTATTSASDPALRTLAGDFGENYYEASNTMKTYAQQVNLTPAASATSTSLAAGITADESAYASLSGSAFDAAWLTAQVSAQSSMLTLIDAKLTASVVDPDLAGILVAQRAQIASALSLTEKVQTDEAADAGH